MFIDYSNLDCIVIHHDGKKYIGEYNTSNFMADRGGKNDLVFEILSIKNKYEFIRNVVGYTPREGVFPCLKTKEDFIKVLDALNKEYDRQFGSEECINIENCKNGDYLYVEDGKFKAIYIFREHLGNIVCRHAFYRCDNGDLDTDEGYLDIKSTTKIRKATSDEIQTLNNALLVKKGLFWNPISKQLEKVESSISVGVLGTTSAGVPAIANTTCNQKLVYKALEVENIIERPSTPSETVPDISIKTFIKPKKHYKLNFNN